MSQLLCQTNTCPYTYLFVSEKRRFSKVAKTLLQTIFSAILRPLEHTFLEAKIVGVFATGKVAAAPYSSNRKTQGLAFHIQRSTTILIAQWDSTAYIVNGLKCRF